VEREQRKLSAIMSLDMVGYSRMMELDESGTLSRYREITEQIISPTVAAHHGRIFKNIGDGILAEFNSAVDSVECGIEIQKLSIEKSNSAKTDLQISFRIGINLGDVVISGEDILGDGVNIAARVESLAEPGQVLISGSTFEQVNGKLDIHISDCGFKRVKNINRAIHVYSIDPKTNMDTSAKLGAIVDKGSLPIIAVLPFQNMSRIEEDEYFADGLTEDIITALSQFRELLVIARNSTFQYKGKSVDVSKVGRELNASYVLEGSLRRSANRARITAQLIKVSDGTHVWANKYDRELEDIFDVQDELTQTIAAALGVRLQDAVREIAMRKNHADLNAYDCVLRSRRYTQTLNPEEHSMARDLLEKAVILDPGYADAFAMLSNVYLAEYRFDANPRPKPIERSMEMAEKATELDPQNAYARCWLAICNFFLRENETFIKEAQRALSLNPNDPEIMAEVGHYYCFMGEFERGVELTRKAIVLNPLHPGWYYFSFARKHFADGDYAAAVTDVRKINLPNFYWSWLIKAAALGLMGEKEAGKDAVDRLNTLVPGFSAQKELYKWNTQKEDVDQFMLGLENAGYQEPTVHDEL